MRKAFEKNGLLLEQFDYHGTGEAEGQFCDVTMDSLRNDLHQIIGNEKVCLIGTRLGAAVAFDFCRQEQPIVQTLILIEPIINGPSYTEYLFKKQHLKDILTGNCSRFANRDGFFNLEGYKTSNAFLEQIKNLHFNEIVNRIKADAVFILQISFSSGINAEYDHLVEGLKKNGIPTSIEVFNLPVFWERIPESDYSAAIEKIVEWCQ
jgi:hypothetical protein